MKLPFHGVQVCGNILFAARGGNIHSFKLADGSHISTARSCQVVKDVRPNTGRLVIEVSENSTPVASQEEQGPPAKRVKVDNETDKGEDAIDKPAGAGEGVDEDEVNGGKQNQRRRKGQKLFRPGNISQPSERPMVNILTATKDGSHLIAVTSDKCIWVFEHDGQGQLKELSRRYVDSQCYYFAPVKLSVPSADRDRPACG